jgi:hypothetical protein
VSLMQKVLCRYGPFWIATTLVFLSAVFGNLSNYISWKRHHSGDPNPSAWFYDVDKVASLVLTQTASR